MNDAEYERTLDRRVQKRLASDPAYRNAANAEEQAEREDEIELEEINRLRYEYEQRNMAAAHAQGLHAESPREGCPECER